MKLKIIASNAFKKDLKSAKKRGLKLDKLQSIVDKLADEIPLEQSIVTTHLQETIRFSRMSYRTRLAINLSKRCRCT